MSTFNKEWFKKNQQLLQDVGKHPFGKALGSTIVVNPNQNPEATGPFTFPGLIRLGFMPVLGGQTDDHGAVNIAARNIYSWVRHANSGRSNYESSDLMIYILGMTQLYGLYAWLSRLYGIARSYNNKNRYYPKVVVESMGMNFDDVVANLAQLRYQINSLQVKIGSMAVPKDMPYFSRTIGMVSGIYTDMPNEKSQSYIYDYDAVVKFNPHAVGGGALEYVDWTKTGQRRTVAQVSLLINQMLDPIISNEDMNIMSGDILKAFGNDGIVKLAIVPETFVIGPSYDEGVLSEIENATLIGGISKTNVSILQEGNVIKNIIKTSDKKFISSLVDNKIINVHTDVPTSEEVMQLSRLTVIGDENAENGITVNNAGTELLTDITLYRITTGATGTFGIESHSISPYYDMSEITSDDLKALSLYNHFRRKPFITMYENTLEGTSFLNEGYYANDVNNYAIFSYEDVKQLHEVALLTLFEVPQIARNK